MTALGLFSLISGLAQVFIMYVYLNFFILKIPKIKQNVRVLLLLLMMCVTVIGFLSFSDYYVSTVLGINSHETLTSARLFWVVSYFGSCVYSTAKLSKFHEMEKNQEIKNKE